MTFRGFSGFAMVLMASLSLLAGEPAVPQVASSSAGPPPLPSPRSPVDAFRELLALDKTARVQALTNRSAAVQQRLLEKVAEYERMSPEARELRLRATEVRWYLVPLLKMPAAQRPALTATVPAELQKLVSDRLVWWDLLPPGAQRELIENELALDYVTQAGEISEDQKQRLLGSLPPDQREKLEASIQRWQAMPAAERQRLFQYVNRFFELTAQEKQKALGTLSVAERQQMENTLAAFGKFSREQRLQCIRSFGKFATMSAVQRQQFLKNAERWSALAPDERQTWRDVVRRLPEMPPLPPGFGIETPPMPPARNVKPPGLATNGG